jgi:outer membrane protein OmpA-like peptidoglycan-associated protein
VKTNGLQQRIVSLALGGAALLLSPGMLEAQGAESYGEVEYSTPAPTVRSRLSLRLEPGLALPLTDPQSEIYDTGGAVAIKLNFSLSRYLEIGPTVAFTGLPAEQSMMDGGTSWGFGGGARLLRPRDVAPGSNFSALSPWVGVDLLYVRTGDLDRPGLAAAAGVGFPMDERRRFWLGPYVRYFQIYQGDKAGFDDGDARILSVGLSLEVGSGLTRSEPRVAAADVEVEPTAEPEEQAADRDGDGVADGVDNCPDVAGLVENDGCPAYDKVIVKKDKLEVNEKIAFKWNSAELEPSSYAALDEVVRALNDNQSFRVQVEGHASSEGSEAHNQTLSEQRAIAVLDYLASKGVARDRLGSKGFSSSVPASTNQTSAGRERNRRVEFTMTLILVKENTP